MKEIDPCEMHWGPEDDYVQAPCKYGQIVPGHACYCQNHHEDAPRKCPIWKRGKEWSLVNCELFEVVEFHE